MNATEQQMEPNQGAGDRAGRSRDVISLILALAFLALLTILARRYDISLASGRELAASMGMVPTFTFIAILYAVISVAPVPGRDVLKIIAALIFGFAASTCLIWAGEAAAALLAFGIARLGGRGVVKWFLGSRIDRIDRAAIKFSPAAVFVARILPITPYRFFNFACGLTAMPLPNYVYGSIPGILVRTAFFQYIFAKGGEALLSKNVGLSTLLLFEVGLGVLLVGIWLVYARIKSRR